MNFILDQKTNKWKVKHLLGNNKVVVKQWATGDLTPAEGIKLNKANGGDNGIEQIASSALRFLSFQCLGIREDQKPALILDGVTYYPLYIGSVWTKPHTKPVFKEQSAHINTFFIRGISTPDTAKILKRLEGVFKNEYPGTPHIIKGKYLFCLDNLNTNYIRVLLDGIKAGDGKELDYTWIAPLQDILDERTEAFERSKKRKPIVGNGPGKISPPIEEEDGPMDWDIPASNKFGWMEIGEGFKETARPARISRGPGRTKPTPSIRDVEQYYKSSTSYKSPLDMARAVALKR